MSLRTMLGLDRDYELPAPPPGVTHVLYFAPSSCGADPAWYLVPAADWCSGRPPLEWTFLGEMQPDYDLAVQPCASFAAETLGFPVILTEFAYPGVNRWKTEQAFWITPEA